MSRDLPFPRLKRNALRRVRRAIAAGSMLGARDVSATHTRLFPLRDGLSDDVWSIARDASIVLRGLGEGSIFSLVLSLHAAGWRLFASGGEREAFELARRADATAFDAAMKQRYPDIEITAAALRDVLSKAPRKVGKESTVDVLAPRLAKALGAKLDHGVVDELARALVEAFDTWSAMSAVDGEVAKVIDGVLTSHGPAPSLQALWGVALPEIPKDFGVPTIAFDASIAPVEESTPRGRFAAVIARLIAETGGLNDKSAAAVQSRFTTANANALSWLLGVGRRALMACARDDAQRAFGIAAPDADRALDPLVNGLRALPALKPLGERVYVEARASTAGTIDSLLATYVLRLVALDDMLTTLRAQRDADRPTYAMPDFLRSPIADSIFEGMPFTREDLQSGATALDAAVDDASLALDIVTGRRAAQRGDYDRAVATLDAFGAQIERLDAVLSQLNARIVALNKESDLPFDKLPLVLGGGRWKKLVEIRERESEALIVRPQLEGQLADLVTQADEAFAALNSAHPMTWDRVVEHEEQEERRDLEMARRRGRIGDDAMKRADIPAMARRRLLDRIARVCQRAQTPLAQAFVDALTRQRIIKPGAASERTLKAFLFSGECAMRSSVFDPRKRLVILEHDALLQVDPEAVLDALEDAANRAASVRDAMLVRFAREALLLGALPEHVHPSAISSSADHNRLSWVDLRPGPQGLRRSEVIKTYVATYHSAANGLLYRLNKTRFIEQWDLRCAAGPTALFVPQARPWTLPPQYRVGRFGAVLDAAGLRERVDAGPVDSAAFARDLARWIRANKASPSIADAMTMMSQVPHAWAIACEFEGAPVYEGALVSNGELVSWGERRAFLLETPRHFAGDLRSAFVDGKLSPHGLIFERHFERDGNTVRETARRVVAAIPIARPLVAAESAWEPRAVVGLDLNEAHLGAVVRDLATGAETALLLPVRKTYRLAHSEKRYRTRQQPRQQFRAAYSRAAEDAIKAAIGEVCSLIDNLIAHYHAVPVFESGLTRARASNVMVKRVFAGVVHRYAFIAGNQVANAVRQSHWFGAGRWSYPHLGMDLTPDARAAGKRLNKLAAEKAFRPAMGFPGALVSGYRTSLICSACNTDALDLLDMAVEGGQKAVISDADGVITLFVGGNKHRLRIEQPSPNKATQAYARAKKRRTPWEVVALNTWDLSKRRERTELSTLIKNGLRRAPSAIQGLHTSKSVFHCANADCSLVHSAETNAGAHLARRYIARVDGLREACATWDDPAVRERIQARVAAADSEQPVE